MIINKDTPLVSIIVCCFNSQPIEKCVESLMAQTFLSFEIIIVNLEKNDDSGKNWKLSEKIALIEHFDKSVSSGRNLGLDQAKGRFVIFLNDDDQLLPDTLEKCVEIFLRDNIDAIFFESSFDFKVDRKFITKSVSTGRPEHFYHKVVDGNTFFVESILNDQYFDYLCMLMVKRTSIGDINFSEACFDDENIFTAKFLLQTDISVYTLPNKLHNKIESPYSFTQSTKLLNNFYNNFNTYKILKEIADSRAHDSMKVCLDKYLKWHLRYLLDFALSKNVPLNNYFLLAKCILDNRLIISKYRQALNILVRGINPKRYLKRS